MKTKFFAALFAVVLACTLSSFKSVESSSSSLEKRFFLKKSVDITITSTGGCTFHIHGTVTFSLIPANISDFDGTVTIGGGRDCPHGSFEFRTASATIDSRTNEVDEITYDANDVDALTYLKGDASLDSQLKDELTAIINEP